jgi:fibronectin type 3 domain-containing protein
LFFYSGGIMPRFFVISVLAVIVIMFAGCGGGTDSINTILDIKNPDVVKSVSAYSAHRRVRITWTKSSNENVIGYNIYRSSAGFAGFIQIGSVGQMSSPYFQDEGDDTDGDGVPDGLANNVTYFYKVTAFDRSGRETPIELAAAVAATPGQLPFDTVDLSVQNLRAYGSDGQVFLTWSRIEQDRIFGYNVYRSVSGRASGFQLIAVTPAEVNSFVDGGLDPNESFIYQVAPAVNEIETYNGESMISGLLEGRKVESRAVRPMPGDPTTPKPPGSSPGAAFSVMAQSAVINGKPGTLVRWTRPTANTDGSIIADADDLVSGSYLIYRSPNLYGPYLLVGIIENLGSGNISEFFDPTYNGDDHTNHFYYVKVGDALGNLSARSDIASVNSQCPPPTIKNMWATSGQGFGSIQIFWDEITDQRVDGYNIYRSSLLETGYVPVAYNITDEDPDPTKVRFTDVSAALNIGQTYYYKISASANGLESALSAATAGSPGPANGIIVLQGENAVKVDSYLNGNITIRTPLASHAAQYWPPHWHTQRMGYHAPFSGNGVLFVNPKYPATSNIMNGERLDLMWRFDVQPLIGTGSGVGSVTVDVYMTTADEPQAGQYQIFLDDQVISREHAPGTELPALPVRTGFDGIQTEINFADQSYSTPLQPRRRLIGSLSIRLIDYDTVAQYADTEMVYMTIIHRGPQNADANCYDSSSCGYLKLDALTLVVR